MDYCIRELRKSEFPLLEHFLYEAIFIPNGCGPELSAKKRERMIASTHAFLFLFHSRFKTGWNFR